MKKGTVKREFSLLKAIIKNNIVFFVAFTAAVITMFIIPPDGEYGGYFDFKTLSCLFCTLAVVNALKDIGFFNHLAQKIIARAGTLRLAVLLLVYITFIGSMFIANDMALLTFLPLGYYVLTSSGTDKYMAYVFILQTIAANLGGMLTPFGNPQNLYLYSVFQIPDGEFVSVMALPFAVSMTLVTLCCLFFPKHKITVGAADVTAPPKGRTAFYLVLFALTVVMVFRILPYYVILPIIFAAIWFADRKALLKVDYFLLLTFAAFFVFSGNMARIPEVSAFFSALLEKNTLLTSVLSCQVISNVPSAVLLSQFTSNYRDLLVGVNIGGTGTLIASLASLITFRVYVGHNKGKGGRYVLLYSLFSFGFLAVLVAVCSI